MLDQDVHNLFICINTMHPDPSVAIDCKSYLYLPYVAVTLVIVKEHALDDYLSNGDRWIC